MDWHGRPNRARGTPEVPSFQGAILVKGEPRTKALERNGLRSRALYTPPCGTMPLYDSLEFVACLSLDPKRICVLNGLDVAPGLELRQSTGEDFVCPRDLLAAFRIGRDIR